MRFALIVIAACAVGIGVVVSVDATDRPRRARRTNNNATPLVVAAPETERASANDDAPADDDAPTPRRPASTPTEAPSDAPSVDPDRILDDPIAMISTAMPTRWMRAGPRCVRTRGRRTCDGPRRAPRPEGDAALLARRLGIGTRAMASNILSDPPEQEWIDAVGMPASETLLWPVTEGHLWRGFGMVRHGRRARRLHKGLDIGAPPGTLIRSVDDGLVVYADNEVRGYGNLLMVLHGDGAVTFYAHCRRLYLFAGQHIRRGQVLGEIGDTGLARGPHLHFEWHVRGRPRNPLPRMVGRADDSPPLGS